MSNLERHPSEILECSGDTGDAGASSVRLQILTPRVVPLGGPRAMTVRRTLPSKQRSLIGAWCFLDHYGPEPVASSGGMRVPPHPHTGLQTVSWLFEGEIEHRDSVGSHAIVRPGELNLMTAGRGISHSEVSMPTTNVLHGAQLWVALPEASRHVPPAFESQSARRVRVGDAEVQVFMGSLAGVSADATLFSALVAAQLDLPAGGVVELGVEAGFEHGILVDSGEVSIRGSLPGDDATAPDAATSVQAHELAYLPTGCTGIRIVAGDTAVRLLLIGGEPLREKILMWWNFVGRSHDEVVGYRAAWQSQAIGVGGPPPPGTEDLFTARVAGATLEHEGAPLPAPELPSVRLRPRD
ncbi:pirin [Subtercola boreus]|uniref:Pirin n=1 Tax=Subtercola boreus TaxID=120213 RepID=A0A3E0VSU2_9MICO|nr:pirin family protein [Subtercola boreus]RFA12433.1 pirin [Subtercola boreus]